MPDELVAPQFSDDAVRAAAEKLKIWVETLPAEQQDVFGWILTRAAAADNAGAERYAMEAGTDVPFDKLMNDASGATEAQDITGYMINTARLGLTDIDPIPVWTYKW